MITLKIQTPQYVEDCMVNDCKYVLETCIGSGRSENERCLWSPFLRFANNLLQTRYLANIIFDVDDVQSSFYFNANLSYYKENSLLKSERFKDVIFRYKEIQTIYSLEFTTLTMEMRIKCKSGFYPKNKCSVSCFDNPPIYKCDELGNKICLKGYFFDPLSNHCLPDYCSRDQQDCQNNGTCINEPQGSKCYCAKEFSGDSCEIWDPCLNHGCLNGGYCMIRKAARDYICQCLDNFYGKYCEHVENPCFSVRCGQSAQCEIVENEAKCVMKKTKPSTTESTNILGTLSSKSKLSSIKLMKKEKIDNFQIEKETVRLVQYHPFRNEYTTLAIIMVLVVFMLGSFGVLFWILKIKYSRKKGKMYANYPTLPIMPSIFNTASTYRSGEDNFRRWHSLDDNSFYVCNQFQGDGNHPYRSGSHIWPKHDHTIDSYRDNYPSLNSPHRMCHSMIRPRMPRLCEPGNLDSSDLNFNGTVNSQNDSEKMDDFNNYLGIDDPAIIDI